MSSTIIVSEERHPVHVFDEDLDRIHIGDIVSRVYEGERVQRHLYEPNSAAGQVVGTRNFKDEKVYSLGPTTTRFDFVDHAEALAPLVERGFTIEKQYISKGGLNLTAILTPPNATEIEDPIHWDDARFTSEQHLARPRRMNESVMVQTSIRPGKAINYRRGWFRLICTNGLVAEVMDLGSARFNHANFSGDRLLEKIDSFPRMPTDGDKVFGPIIGNAKGCNSFASLLERLAEGRTAEPEADEDDEGDGTEFDQEIPFFARKHVSVFSRIPTWFLLAYASNLRDAAKMDQGVIRALDILNAVTNPINSEGASENAHSIFRPLNRTGSIIEATVTLLGAMSLA